MNARMGAPQGRERRVAIAHDFGHLPTHQVDDVTEQGRTKPTTSAATSGSPTLEPGEQLHGGLLMGAEARVAR